MYEKIISVGIDIGTSTTQLIFSEITIENLAGIYTVPKFSIVDKKIIYESEVIFTPFIDYKNIDVDKIKEFVVSEYKKADIKFEDVKTGAVIITGESARKENAKNVVNVLSGFAGDFVVATAGPDLESVLSGRGSGADKISKDLNSSVVNIDIGGGTSNISYFDKGQLKGVTCLDIGGRLIKFKNNKIEYIYHKTKSLLEKNGIDIKKGDDIDLLKLKKACSIMSNILISSVNKCNLDFEYVDLFTNGCNPLSKNLVPKHITFSGGVGKYIYDNKINLDDTNLFKYEDIGIILSKEIAKTNLLYNQEIIKPKETIRATVVGAGMHTTEISGSTIYYDKKYLPIKNIPVIRVDDSKLYDISNQIKESLKLYLQEDGIQLTAVSLNGENTTSFKQIQDISQQIIEGMDELIKRNYPIIVITEKDIAKALGNAISLKLGVKDKVICIDNIRAFDRDYIDIGEPIGNSIILPVVVKTLVFNT